jgi:hypothetical protein
MSLRPAHDSGPYDQALWKERETQMPDIRHARSDARVPQAPAVGWDKAQRCDYTARLDRQVLLVHRPVREGTARRHHSTLKPVPDRTRQEPIDSTNAPSHLTLSVTAWAGGITTPRITPSPSPSPSPSTAPADRDARLSSLRRSHDPRGQRRSTEPVDRRARRAPDRRERRCAPSPPRLGATPPHPSGSEDVTPKFPGARTAPMESSH